MGGYLAFPILRELPWLLLLVCILSEPTWIASATVRDTAKVQASSDARWLDRWRESAFGSSRGPSSSSSLPLVPGASHFSPSLSPKARSCSGQMLWEDSLYLLDASCRPHKARKCGQCDPSPTLHQLSTVLSTASLRINASGTVETQQHPSSLFGGL